MGGCLTGCGMNLIGDVHQREAEELLAQRDALAKALRDIIKDVGTSTLAWKVATDALAALDKEAK